MTPLAPAAKLALRAAAPDVIPVPGPDFGLDWRPLAPRDSAALARLVATTESLDDPPFRTMAAEVTEWLSGSWKDLTRDTLGGFDPRGALCAFAFAEVPPGDVTMIRAGVHGGVLPAYRGRGIGAALVRWMQARGRQLLAEHDTTVPARVGTFLEGSAGAEHDLYAAAGFAPRRWFRTMRRDLAEPSPEVRLALGLRLVPWSPALDDAIRLAHNEAFVDHWGSQPQTSEQWTGNRSTFVPRWSFAILDDTPGDRATLDGAVRGGATPDDAPQRPAVAAYLLSERYEDDWPVVGYSFGYVHQLGVRRPWRRQGLAVALLAAAMDAFRSEGLDHAVLDVDTENPTGANGLYARVGFTPDHGSVLYTIEI
jgi:ribosomal protein S18 acetylase RimI-like enzyme